MSVVTQDLLPKKGLKRGIPIDAHSGPLRYVSTLMLQYYLSRAINFYSNWLGPYCWTGLLRLSSQSGFLMDFFNLYGWLVGTFWPKEFFDLIPLSPKRKDSLLRIFWWREDKVALIKEVYILSGPSGNFISFDQVEKRYGHYIKTDVQRLQLG